MVYLGVFLILSTLTGCTNCSHYSVINIQNDLSSEVELKFDANTGNLGGESSFIETIKANEFKKIKLFEEGFESDTICNDRYSIAFIDFSDESLSLYKICENYENQFFRIKDLSSECEEDEIEVMNNN